MANAKNPLIFLVEDDPVFRKMIDAYLRSQRLTNIKQFGSGEEMLKQLATEMPLVVVEDFDLGAGKLNGLEIFKKAREINPKIEFVFLSGQSNIEVAVEAIKLGAFDYVVKDEFAKENLLNRLKRFVFQKQLSSNHQALKVGGIIFITALILMIIGCYLAGVHLVIDK